MYDVFISYKKTDENGNDTADSVLAKKLYTALQHAGLKVFFSEHSLEQIGSSRYKNDIDHALDSAKAMIVVLTNPEYAQSHWVQYEWDSFYNDFLSGIRPNANLFTFTRDVDIHALPRTLRNVQNFDANNGFSELVSYICSALHIHAMPSSVQPAESSDNRFTVLTGSSITYDDIKEAVELDHMVYDTTYFVEPETCYEWFKVNPDIYVMLRDNSTNKVVAYINISPITEECYDDIRTGQFIDTGITAEMILSYNMPFPYCAYFSSVVIHPDYQNSSVFKLMFDEVVKKFIHLGEQETYIKKMIADAVSIEGEKFCKLFGMKKVDATNHGSSLYEVNLIPPEFRVTSKMTKQLYEYYKSKYEEESYLFDD